MNSQHFVIWLKGFSKAANSYNVTPEQWESIVEELNKVDEEPSPLLNSIKSGANSTYTYPIVSGNTTTTIIDEKTPKTLLNG